MTDWIVAGFMQSVVWLMLACVALGAVVASALWFAVPWVWHHVAVVIR